MIKIEKLVKTYGSGELELVVLKSLTFEVKAGEFVAIIGPSGSGKSTLLYQLSLLDEPTSGEVTLDGIRTGELSMQEKTDIRLGKLGYVFQDYALLPELTALENVALPIIMQGHTMQESYVKASLALERIGMVDKKHNVPSQLSGGQQQRVSIARAIAHEPQILFADEPTANLDSANGIRVMEAFRDLHTKSNQTIIMVTHEPEYAAFAGRIITLVDGTIVSDERKKDLP
ncbi:MAG: ABC transporter ATP-binding protein [Patescibacteria group bacterium]|mgnify:CR=1 FL=1